MEDIPTNKVLFIFAHITLIVKLIVKLISFLRITLPQELDLLDLLLKVMIVIQHPLYSKITLLILSMVTEQLYFLIQAKTHALKLQILLRINALNWALGVCSQVGKLDSII
jgi:hypothetical protein